jgi:hypothetical protein
VSSTLTTVLREATIALEVPTTSTTAATATIKHGGAAIVAATRGTAALDLLDLGLREGGFVEFDAAEQHGLVDIL